MNYDRVRKLLERDSLWEDVQRFLVDHPKVGFVESAQPASNWLPSDPDDNWVIQSAITARAERIITGDKRLRGLDAVEGVKIVTVREMLTEVGIGSP